MKAWLQCIAFGIGAHLVAIGLMWLGNAGPLGAICMTAIVLGWPLYLGWKHGRGGRKP